jgi:hypothetical protein
MQFCLFLFGLALSAAKKLSFDCNICTGLSDSLGVIFKLTLAALARVENASVAFG